MGVEISDTVSLLEAAWTVGALCGLMFSLFNVLESTRDLLALKSRRQHIPPAEYRELRLVGRDSLWSDCSASYVQIMFLAVGISSMLSPSNPGPLSLSAALLAFGAISVSFILAANSIRRRVVRHTQIELIRGRMRRT